MIRKTFKKRQLKAFCDMLSFSLYDWQFNAVWQFYSNKLNEFHLIAPRQNGKSQILVVIALIEMFLNESKITFTSHQVKSADDFFRKVKWEVEHNSFFSQEIKRTTNQKGSQLIELWAGNKIEFICRTKDGGIGDSNDVIIFDEFQMLNEKQMSAIFPTLAARPNSITIYAGTSPRTLDDDTFYRKQRKDNYGTIKWLEYGIGEKYTLQELIDKNMFLDKKLIKEVNPSFERMIPYENIIREFGKMDQLDFAIQRLGLFHTQLQKVVFKEDVIKRSLISNEQAQAYKGNYIISIKFGINNHAAVIATSKDNSVYIQVIDKRPNSKGFEWLADIILASKKCQGIIVDGLYAETFKLLVKKKFFNNYKTMSGFDFIAAQNVFEQEMIAGKLKLANQSSIVSELQNVSWKNIKDYSKFSPVTDDVDVIVAEAMAMANFYVKQRGV